MYIMTQRNHTVKNLSLRKLIKQRKQEFSYRYFYDTDNMKYFSPMAFGRNMRFTYCSIWWIM